ncbi:MAG: AAA family ATPase [Planctomycetota bacterium]|nr:AAA family ATPase [Planctomycetota bacterium]
MYTDFFGLREPPFNSTQDSRFFFPSPQHEEALACLVYAVQERKGLVVITGEVGSGKSLAIHMLIKRLGSDAEAAVLSTSQLAGMDLLQGVCREFQVPLEASSNTMESLAALEEYLLAVAGKNRPAVLVLDDAHALSETNLEQLRLISNLEVSGGKLMQVVLAGQQDLNQCLQKNSAKQLRQRVFRNYHITRLSSDLTRSYIRLRLQVAGQDDSRIFQDAAIELIHEYSNGIPRLINNLCDNLLLSAYSDDTKTIDRKRVNLVIDEMMASSQAHDAGVSDGCPDDVEQAISEITNQYVRSLEAQIGELETAGADTDQRIHELHRLSAKLQAQELKLTEHQPAIDAKIRDLHRLTATLQAQEESLGQREKAVTLRVEELQALSERLDVQDNKMSEREIKLAQQLRNVQRLSASLAEQDAKLDERADFIDKKLANRQVSFDRELNECKRAINRKWEVIKQLMAQYESKETTRTKRLATMDQQLLRFEKSRGAIADIAKRQDELVNRSRQAQLDLENKAKQTEQAGAHLGQLLQKADIMLNQPKELMATAERQMEQVERMTQIVQKATDALQKTVRQSLGSSKKITAEGRELSQRLEGLEEDASASLKDLEERCAKTHELREVLRQIYDQSASRVQELGTLMTETERAMAKLPKQLDQLRENSVHPTRLMKELRSVGSAAERNLHDGQLRLAELRTMIERANKARRSIEALVTATRRVADNRRSAAAPGQISTAAEGLGESQSTALADKIDSLTETVRRSRGRGWPTRSPLAPSNTSPPAAGTADQA